MSRLQSGCRWNTRTSVSLSLCLVSLILLSPSFAACGVKKTRLFFYVHKPQTQPICDQNDKLQQKFFRLKHFFSFIAPHVFSLNCFCFQCLWSIVFVSAPLPRLEIKRKSDTKATHTYFGSVWVGLWTFSRHSFKNPLFPTDGGSTRVCLELVSALPWGRALGLRTGQIISMVCVRTEPYTICWEPCCSYLDN